CRRPPAAANAIARAIGVRMTHMPMTPERILRALKGEAFGTV
ncbi:MAG: xanthine dehydrogenase family protein molybdopterin-binding subunit, partial [Sphingomonadales bacterium]|nr:xanthine dehydrogenase family protein molybdopterin-binding subunit [Sphingomonadales bacterium]